MIFRKIKNRISQDEYYLRAYTLLKQLSIILIVFQFCRVAFLIINYNYFFPLKYKYILASFLYGIHYDISSIIKYNGLYILLILIPAKALVNNNNYRQFLNLFFIVLNSFAILINISDIAYFKYANKRTTYELVYYIKTMNIELLKLLPIYAIQYWYLLIGFILMIFFIIKFRLKKEGLIIRSQTSRVNKVVSFLIIILFLGLLARGLGKSPLKSLDVDRFMPIEYGALATNTPFTIIEAYSNDDNTYYFAGSDSGNTFDLEKKYSIKDTFTRQNVVIIILESFSKEYIGSLNDNEGYTPFLDSLIKQGLVCRNAYANGRTTLQALPAILCSLPSLGESPLVLSLNKHNSLNSLADLLNKEGYSSSFFYGARNGNLGINNFARKAGFQNYFGRNEFRIKCADSPWGIFDGEFLLFAATKIDSFREPFMSCILTLSSHSPFVIPQKLQNKFNQPTPQLKSIAYTDFCLKQFFEKASKSKWYNNTLFVIVADHASYPYSFKYNSNLGIFSIPILYFHNNDLKLRGYYDNITQQCDIKPSILEYLHYKKRFVSFGSSIFSFLNKHYAIMKLANNYQYIDSLNVISISKTGELLSAYKYRVDKLLLNDLSNSHRLLWDNELLKSKAIIYRSLK
jgi:phosphoglycerol transferase MdoB-like AlkP superfamily enzyme